MGAHVHNWEEIRTAYVTSSITLNALADQYDVGYELVRKHSSAEKWSQGREDFWKFVNDEIASITANNAALQKKDFDQAASLAADLIVAKIAEQIANIETTVEGIDKDGIEIKKSIGAKLASLSATLQSAITSKYRVLDVPAPTVRIQDVTPPPIAAIPDAQIGRMVEEKMSSAMLVPLSVIPDDDKSGNGHDGNGELE